MTAPKAKHRVPDIVKMVQEYYATPGNDAGGALECSQTQRRRIALIHHLIQA